MFDSVVVFLAVSAYAKLGIFSALNNLCFFFPRSLKIWDRLHSSFSTVSTTHNKTKTKPWTKQKKKTNCFICHIQAEKAEWSKCPPLVRAVSEDCIFDKIRKRLHIPLRFFFLLFLD